MHKILSTLEDKLATLHGSKLKDRLKSENAHGKSLFKNKTPTNIIRHITSHDPTIQGSYKKWLTNTYVNKGIRYAEDLPRAREALTTFDKHKHKLPVEKRDIQKYKTLPELEQAVEPFTEKDKQDSSWSQKSKEFIKDNQANELHNDKDYQIVQPHTTEASQHFGINTKWCTAAKNDNQFVNYNKTGKLYYILHKSTNKRFAFYEPNISKINPQMEPEAFDEKDKQLDTTKFHNDHPKAVNTLSYHIDPLHWDILDKQPTEEQLDKHMSNPNPWVKRQIAEYGYPKHLEKLKKHSNPVVRSKVAEKAPKEILGTMLKDTSPWVKTNIVERKYPEHLDELLKDKNPHIRYKVAEFGNNKHRDKLLKDPNLSVLRGVIRFGSEKHLKELANHKKRNIRYHVALKTKNKNLLKQLAEDRNPYVKNVAIQKLAQESFK